MYTYIYIYVCIRHSLLPCPTLHSQFWHPWGKVYICVCNTYIWIHICKYTCIYIYVYMCYILFLISPHSMIQKNKKNSPHSMIQKKKHLASFYDTHLQNAQEKVHICACFCDTSIWTHIYIYMYICMYIYMYIYTYMYIYLYMYLYLCIYYVLWDYLTPPRDTHLWPRREKLYIYIYACVCNIHIWIYVHI